MGALRSATAVVGKPEQRALDALHAARELGIRTTDQEQLAYELYGSSFFQPAADARFLMLMMAVETLIEQKNLSDDVKVHVDQLITFTRRSSLPSNEIDSMVGTLRWLYKESVSRAGRRLASKLGDRLYVDGTETPITFFNRSYEMRSYLVHGYYPRPTRDEVDKRAAKQAVTSMDGESTSRVGIRAVYPDALYDLGVVGEHFRAIDEVWRFTVILAAYRSSSGVLRDIPRSQPPQDNPRTGSDHRGDSPCSGVVGGTGGPRP